MELVEATVSAALAALIVYVASRLMGLRMRWLGTVACFALVLVFHLVRSPR